MRIEYKVLMSGGDLPSEENMNELGADGWQLQNLIFHDGKLYVYLSRRLAEAVN